MKYLVNDIEIDITQFQLSKQTEVIPVEPKVFDLIVYLLEHRNRLITRDELFDQVWNGRDVSDTTLSNHIKSARKALDDNGEKQAVIKTVRGRGYQFIGDVIEASSDQPIQPKTSPFNKKLYQLVIAVLLVIISVLLLRPFHDINKTVHHIAVLPFKNLKPSEETDYLGFAIADRIIGDLAYSKGFSVRGSSSIRQYQAIEIDAIEAGEALKVNYVLMGTYQKDKNSIRLNVELVNVTNNDMVWRRSFDEQSDQIFNFQNLVTREVAHQLNVDLTHKEIENITGDIATNPLAYEYYLRARAFPDSTEGARLAISFLEKAIGLDEHFAPNYVEQANRIQFLSLYNLDRNDYQLAAELYHKALKLKPNLTEAIGGLARIYIETGQIDLAMQYSQKLLELSPNNANAYFALGYVYRYAGYMEESISAFKSAIELNPNDRWSHNLGVSYLYNGNLTKAHTALSIGRQSSYSLGWITSTFEKENRIDEALKTIEEVIQMNAGSFWEYDAIATRSMLTGDKQRGIEALNKLRDANVDDGEALFYWATLYASLADVDNSLKMLNKAFDKGFFNLRLYQEEKKLDVLRTSEEFRTLLSKVNAKHLDFKARYL